MNMFVFVDMFCLDWDAQHKLDSNWMTVYIYKKDTVKKVLVGF